MRHEAYRHSVPEHRLGVLKQRIGDYCRGERRLLPQKVDAAAAVAAVDEIRRHYLPTSALQNDRDITAATARIPASAEIHPEWPLPRRPEHPRAGQEWLLRVDGGPSFIVRAIGSSG